jgi:AcrR family transcriptional regulator
MPRRPIETSPRKIPRQARARATLDAVLAATAQVLIAEGYDHTTTARVAERAGVSIGSLYQYFPNKEALVAALVERHAHQILVVVKRALVEVAGADLRTAMLTVIRAAIDAHRIDPRLHKVLHEQVPRVGKLKTAMNTSRELIAAIEAFLRAKRAELHPDRDPAIAAIVIETAVEAIVHDAVVDRGPLLAGDVLERETLALVGGYLARPAVAAASAPAAARAIRRSRRRVMTR